MFTFKPVHATPQDLDPSISVTAITWAPRRIPRSHGGHVTGYHSPGIGRPLVPFESKTEWRAIDFLLGRDGVHFILSQPFTLEYLLYGKKRRYTPDLLVAAQPISPELRRSGFGHLSIVEIKPKPGPELPSAVEARLKLVAATLGMPVLLGTPDQSAPDEIEEVRHAH